MILLVAIAAAVASPPASPPLKEAAHAISAGRLDQARVMIGRAVASGASGEAVHELLAELAFADGRDAEALKLFESLIARDPSKARYFERAAIASFRTGDAQRAATYSRKASEMPDASWRAWNTLGVAADLSHDWESAEGAYREALRLAPDQPEALNNLGWSYVMQGKWTKGADLLQQAAAHDPANSRIAANLELARAALADDLPQRRPGESNKQWSARLNDAGVAALARGQRSRATAAFTRAIEARLVWHERAWNNLQLSAAASPLSD